MEILVKKENILNFKGEAIVNTANSSLSKGMGLDGQIHRYGGPMIENQLARYSHCPVGEVVVTSGGRINVTHIIHAVGPMWHNGNSNEEVMLKKVYENILKKVDALKIESIAIPNISTGIFRFPKEKAAEIALATINEYKGSSLKKVVFYCFDSVNFNIYRNNTNLVSS